MKEVPPEEGPDAHAGSQVSIVFGKNFPEITSVPVARRINSRRAEPRYACFRVGHITRRPGEAYEPDVHVTRGATDSGLKTHERQIAVDREISFVASGRNYAEIDRWGCRNALKNARTESLPLP